MSGSVRRPWEPTDDEIVYCGSALKTIPEDAWLALDYYLGILAAQSHARCDQASSIQADIYLGLVERLRGDLIDKALPEARDRAKRPFDPKRLLRPETILEEDFDSNEPTPEELAEAAAIEQRARERGTGRAR